MSKILFVNPNICIVDREKDHYSVMEHLGLGLLSAMLVGTDHEVSILDCYALDLENSDAITEIKKQQPDFLGITANYLNFDSAVEIARQAHLLFPDMYLFLGGEHCTYSSHEILERYTFVDAIIRGEGEDTLLELIAKAPDLYGVLGVHFRNKTQGRIVKNPDRPGITNLDEIPFANRAMLDYCKKHNMTTAIGMLAQRGCNHQCSFCNANSFFRMGGGLPIRRRSPQNVVKELAELYSKYYLHGNIEKVYFHDANFIDGSLQSKEWAIALAQEIVAQDVVMPFEIYLRGDSLKTGDDEVVLSLKKAGLEAVFVGIESFSDNDLDFYQKDITSDQLIEGMDILKKHRVLGPTAGVIMFNPFSTDDGLIQTARVLSRYGYASFWNLSQKLQLFPGVKLVKELKEEKLLVGYDSTNKVYSYKIQDPCIEALSGYLLSLNQHPTIILDNALPRQIMTELSRILNRLELLQFYNGHIDKLIQPLQKQHEALNALNVSFFIDTVRRFRSGEDMAGVEMATNKYLIALSERLNFLEESFNSTLRLLHEHIIGEKSSTEGITALS